MKKTPSPSIKGIELKAGMVIREFTLVSYIPMQNGKKAAWFVEDKNGSISIMDAGGLKYKSIMTPKRVADAIGHRQLFNVCKQSAKKRKLSFNLTEEQVKSLMIQNCHYCGMQNSCLFKQGRLRLKHNGIDRVDSKIGYEFSNCVPCCTFCNYAKNDNTLEEFNNWIENLIKFRTGVVSV